MLVAAILLLATSTTPRRTATSAAQFPRRLLRFALVDRSISVEVGPIQKVLHGLRQFVLGDLAIAVFVVAHESLGEVAARPPRPAWTARIRTALSARALATVKLRTQLPTAQLAISVLVEGLQGGHRLLDFLRRELAIVVGIERGHQGVRLRAEVATSRVTLTSAQPTPASLSLAVPTRAWSALEVTPVVFPAPISFLSFIRWLRDRRTDQKREARDRNELSDSCFHHISPYLRRVPPPLDRWGPFAHRSLALLRPVRKHDALRHEPR